MRDRGDLLPLAGCRCEHLLSVFKTFHLCSPRPPPRRVAMPWYPARIGSNKKKRQREETEGTRNNVKQSRERHTNLYLYCLQVSCVRPMFKLVRDTVSAGIAEKETCWIFRKRRPDKIPSYTAAKGESEPRKLYEILATVRVLQNVGKALYTYLQLPATARNLRGKNSFIYY